MIVKIKNGKLTTDNQKLPMWLYSVEFEVLKEYDDRADLKYKNYVRTFYKKDIIKIPSN